MQKFRLSVTSDNGQTVAEGIGDYDSRHAAIVDGITELLKGNQFPPEAAQVWSVGAGQAKNDIELIDVHDIMLAKFHLQFSCKEVEDVAQAPPPPAQQGASRPSPPMAPLPTFQNGTPPRLPSALHDSSPRQLLQLEMKRINAEIKRLEPYYQLLIRRRDECRELLNGNRETVARPRSHRVRPILQPPRHSKVDGHRRSIRRSRPATVETGTPLES